MFADTSVVCSDVISRDCLNHIQVVGAQVGDEVKCKAIPNLDGGQYSWRCIEVEVWRCIQHRSTAQYVPGVDATALAASTVVFLILFVITTHRFRSRAHSPRRCSHCRRRLA
jgi:hypothetical protein